MKNIFISTHSSTTDVLAQPWKVAYSPADAATATSVSRGIIYQALNAGYLKAHKLGERTVITYDDLVRWLRALPAYGDTAGSVKSPNAKSTSTTVLEG